MQRRTRARVRGNPEEQARADYKVAQVSGLLLRTPHGTPPPYAAKNTISIVTLEDLAYLRVRYSIPVTVSLRRPWEAERAHFPGPGETCLYIAAFKRRLRLPFPVVVREVLCPFGLAQPQIMPNSWRHLIGCATLWAAMSNGETPFSKEVFLRQYTIKENPNGHGWWYFTRRPSEESELVLDLPTIDKNWKDKFFFIGGNRWELLDGDRGIHFSQVPSH